MSIQVGTSGLFGLAIQSGGLGGSPGTYHWYPYVGCGYGVVQPMQTLPPEAGRTIFTRSNYKTGVWGQGPLSLVPRLDGDLGYILAALIGQDRMKTTSLALTVDYAPTTTPTNVVLDTAGTIAFTGADTLYPVGTIITATAAEDVSNDQVYTVISVASGVLYVTPVPVASNTDDDTITFAPLNCMISSIWKPATYTTCAFDVAGTITAVGIVARFPAGSIVNVTNAEDAANDQLYTVVSTTSTNILNVSPAPGATNAADTAAWFQRQFTDIFNEGETIYVTGSVTAGNDGYHVITGRTAYTLTFSGFEFTTGLLDAIVVWRANSRKQIVTGDPVTPTNVALSATAGTIIYTGAATAFPLGSVIQASSAEDDGNNLLYTVTGASTDTLTVEPMPATTNADDDTITFRKVYQHLVDGIATIPAPYNHEFIFQANEQDIPYFTTRRVLPHSTHASARGESVSDNRFGSGELSLPAVGPMAANFDMVGRTPSFVPGSTVWSPSGWDVANVVFDADNTYALSCDTSSTVMVDGVELQATGIVVTIGNNLLTPDQGRKVGDYSPVDYPVLSRNAMVRVTVLVDNWELYNKLFTNSATGTTWTSAVHRGNLRVRAFSPTTFQETVGVDTDTYQYAIEFINGVDGKANNIAWGLQNAVQVQPQQPIIVTLQGVLEFIDSKTPPFTINFNGDMPSAYA